MAFRILRSEALAVKIPPLVVGFSGAAGVGKTTLTEKLATYFTAEGYQVETVAEVAREVFRLYTLTGGAKSLDDLRGDPENYLCFQKDVFEVMAAKEKRAATGEADLVLCDRTVYDNWLYALLYCTRREGKAFDELAVKVARYLKEPPYDLVVYLPPHGKAMKADSGRASEDAESQTVQDQVLKMLLGTCSGRLCVVEAVKPHERFGYLAYLIREWLESRAHIGKKG